MAERVLKIRNYRNVASQGMQELLLNTSLAKGEMGSLVVVVGPNNCGKSNCLDALVAFGTDKTIVKTDTPDFDNENPIPELSMVLCDDSITIGQNRRLGKNGKQEVEYFVSKKDEKPIIIVEKISNPSANSFTYALQIIQFLVNSGYVSRMPQQFHSAAQSCVSNGRFNGSYELLISSHNACKSIWGSDYYRNNLGISFINEEQLYINCFNEFKIQPNIKPKEILEFEQGNHLSVVPKIVRFAETVASHSQLTINPDQLNTSPFFKVLFTAIDYDINELANCYQKAKEQGLYGLLKRTAKEINAKLDLITKQFNKLFFLSDNKYSFEVSLEKDAIYLSLYINDIPLHLDKQSAGFRWFFNFYFSVVAQTNLSRGDIIVMDEPATNLHMQGIQELRSFMKEFAKRNELTIVISTHIPFFIDVDYLDEVRIVHRVGSGAVIENKFHAIGDNETDALKPIKDALTIGRYVLYDQSNTHTFFVEGITDYCYLTAFKHLIKINNIVFLPIQGLKKSGIFETLIKIERTPTLLIDGDYEGLEFKKKHSNKKGLEIITLSEIDSNWKTIEDLFSSEDKQKTKFFNNAVAFKNRLSNAKISKETKDNFKKLFENIIV